LTNYIFLLRLVFLVSVIKSGAKHTLNAYGFYFHIFFHFYCPKIFNEFLYYTMHLRFMLTIWTRVISYVTRFVKL